MSTTTRTPDGKGFTISGEDRTFFGYLGALEMALGSMKDFAEAHDEKHESPFSESVMELIDDLEIAADRITKALEHPRYEKEAMPYYEEPIK